MLLIADTTKDFVFNFFKCFTFLIEKYNLVDAYFIHQKQRIYVAQLGEEFFNNRENWIGLQQRYVVFNFVSYTYPTDHMFYENASEYFSSRDVVFLPFNWYTHRFIYWDSTAAIKGSGGYYNIFSVDNTVLGYVNERGGVAYSGGFALVMADESGALIKPKTNADGRELKLDNASVIFPVITSGFNCVFLNDNGGTVSVSYGPETNFNFTVDQSLTFKTKYNNTLDFGVSIRRDPTEAYTTDRRGITTKNLDLIQAFQPAIVGVTIVVQPLPAGPSPSTTIILPSNESFVTQPSYQNLFNFSGVRFETYDFENYSVIASSFKAAPYDFAIAKSTSSDSYEHNSSTTSYSGLFYITNVMNVQSIQKVEAVPINGLLFKLFRCNNEDKDVLTFFQGYIDDSGTKVFSTKTIYAEISLSYDSNRIAVFDENLLNDYHGSFSYYDSNNTLQMRGDYSSLPEVEFGIKTARIVFTVNSFTDKYVNLELWNTAPNVAIYNCRIDPSTQQTNTIRCCMSNSIKNRENVAETVYLRTDLPEGLFRVFILMGKNFVIDESIQIKNTETKVDLIGEDYSFVVFTIDPKNLGVETLIANPNAYGSILRMADVYDKEGKMISLMDFPSSGDVRGAVLDDLFTYSIEESGAYKNKQTYAVSTYPKNSSSLSIKNETLLENQYKELIRLSKEGTYPYKIIIADENMTKGVRMMKEAFKIFNYKSAENVVTITNLLFPKWTLNSDGYYYSNYFSYFNNSLVPYLKYISFNGLNTVKNSFSVIYSDVGLESYNRQHPFCIQNVSNKTFFHRKYINKNRFQLWSDKDLDVVVMTFSNYASFNIFY